MDSSERKAWVSVAIVTPAAFLFALWVWQVAARSGVDGNGIGARMALGTLVLMGAVAAITALFNRGAANPSVGDERDRSIALRGMQLSYFVFTVCFVAVLLAVWQGLSSTLVLPLLTGGLMLAELASAIFRIRTYRAQG